ncbi:HFL035Wp [Eremothecium sinecaudum]|uniref:HFL035Wp n=1 Tax=Eremothecium sinecaudum TaxID=45286 RepID=A0A0X8HU13_9SACH|nr:HFL035Wp [Eremothecium sinecaudum]AMD21821.1 HFL035Wp [Eremothecium sinecaudum]
MARMVNIGESIRFCTRRYLCANGGQHANLGDMVTYLKEKTPRLLTECIDNSKLHENVKLRVMPLTRPYIPEASGISHYKAAWKMMQVAMNTFVIRQPCILEIQSMEVDKDQRLIKMRWETVQQPTVGEKQEETPLSGSEKWNSTSVEEFLLRLGMRHNEKWLQGLKKHTKLNNHVVSGLFVFELCENNERITCHTIDEVQLTEEGQEQSNKGGAKAFAI